MSEKLQRQLGLFVLLVLCVVGVNSGYDGSCTIVNVTTVNCVNRSLSEVPDDLPNNITVLDLSLNNLQLLHNGSFHCYKWLQVLNLSNNKISDIHEGTFDTLSTLQKLFLNGNRLHPNNYKANVFKGLTHLNSLNLSKNIKHLHAITWCNYSDIAMSHLTSVERLSIDLCKYSQFGEGFSNMTKLSKLVFDECFAISLDNSTFGHFQFSKVTELQLRNCRDYKIKPDIDKNILAPFKNLKILDLSHSHFSLNHSLKMLYPFQNGSMSVINFHTVSVSQSNSEEIPFRITLTREMTKYLKTICVQTLILSNNGIVDFQKNTLFTFNHPGCLVNFILSANSFGIEYNYKFEDLIEFAASATNLELFDYSYIPLSYSNVKYLSPTTLYSSSRYRGENTHIKGNTTIYIPPKLKTLRLTHIMADITPSASIKVKHFESVRHIDISYFILRDLPELYFDGTLVLDFLDLSGINCFQFINKRFLKSLIQITKINLLNSNLDEIFTPNTVNNILFKNFRNTKVLNISSNHLISLPSDSFIETTTIEELNMTNNLFTHLPDALIKSSTLKTLDVRNNRLRTIDKTIIDWIQNQYDKLSEFNLYMDGNDFYCSCDNMFFIEWLQKTKITLDRKNYFCRLENGSDSNTNTVMLNFTDIFMHCYTSFWVKIGVVLIILSFLLIGIATVVYQYRWRITYYMYRKLQRVYSTTPTELDFTYDVFIGYASDSINWIVHTLVPTLESEWNLKVCLKDRDYPVGACKTDTIISCIKNSNNIIFVLTPGFIGRKWGPFEIDMAKYEMFEQKRQGRVIVITKAGVSKHDIPIELRSIWRNTHLIEWEEDMEDYNNFWYNLKLHLHIAESFDEIP